MNQVLMYYNKIKEDYAIPCPNQAEGKEKLSVCEKCQRNRGFVENSNHKWVRCLPQ